MNGAAWKTNIDTGDIKIDAICKQLMDDMFPSMFSNTMSEFINRLSVGYPSEKCKLRKLKYSFEHLPDNSQFIMDFHSSMTPLIEDIKNNNDVKIIKGIKTALKHPNIYLDIETMWAKSPNENKEIFKAFILKLFEHADSAMNKDLIMEKAFIETDRVIQSNEFLKSFFGKV